MKCERHTQKNMKPNDFRMTDLTFVEHGKVEGTEITRRIALCSECLKAHQAYVNGKSG
jgi:hypothetical protein